MNLEQFGEELKQARVEKGISLMDISSETRVNLKFLEAIEKGQFHILPQTYIRAFLREYALIVGIDPSAIMDRYDAARPDGHIKKLEGIKASEPPTIATASGGSSLFAFSPLQRILAVGSLVVIALVIIVLLANSHKSVESEKPVTEVPFDKVIRETEAATLPPASAQTDSVPIVTAPKIDSLHLQIFTTDSVWLSLLIDGKKNEEFLFGPNKRRTWVAKDQFVITMGNAGGATFQLNGKDLGALGKRGAVLRKTIITKANL